MFTEPRLFRLAVEVLHLHCHHVPGEGWSVALMTRRQGEPWTDADRVEYSHLTTRELFDVLDMELARAL